MPVNRPGGNGTKVLPAAEHSRGTSNRREGAGRAPLVGIESGLVAETGEMIDRDGNVWQTTTRSLSAEEFHAEMAELARQEQERRGPQFVPEDASGLAAAVSPLVSSAIGLTFDPSRIRTEDRLYREPLLVEAALRSRGTVNLQLPADPVAQAELRLFVRQLRQFGGSDQTPLEVNFLQP